MLTDIIKNELIQGLEGSLKELVGYRMDRVGRKIFWSFVKDE